jgi:hypothetical protein
MNSDGLVTQSNPFGRRNCAKASDLVWYRNQENFMGNKKQLLESSGEPAPQSRKTARKQEI